MFGKAIVFFFALSIVFVAGCAQPKYEKAKEADPNGNMGHGSQEQGASACTLRFRTSGYCVSWKWETLPASSRPGSLVFKVYRGNLYDDSPVETEFGLLPVA